MFVRYAFLADHVLFDAVGKMIAVGIFDIIYAQRFPTKHRDMTLAINLEGTSTERGDHSISIELRDEKANKLVSLEQKVKMEKPGVTHGSLRAGMIAKFQDLPFHKAGQYEFVIFADDRFLSRVSFAVSQIRVEKAGEQ
jgi:hypothetical protein